MATFKKQKLISATKEDVWKVLSNYGDICKFNPGVSKSYITSENNEGVGATRVCELVPVGKVSETIKEWQEGDGFLIQVTPIEKLPPITNFTGRFHIEKLSVNTSRVSVSINYEIKLGVIGTILNKVLIQPKLEKSMDDLLRGLKTHVEKNMEIKEAKSSEAIIGWV